MTYFLKPIRQKLVLLFLFPLLQTACEHKSFAPQQPEELHSASIPGDAPMNDPNPPGQVVVPTLPDQVTNPTQPPTQLPPAQPPTQLPPAPIQPPPPTQPPTTPPVVEFKLTCDEAQFIVLLNIYRKQNSLNELQVSKSGTIAARWHANNMMELNYFSHTEPNGRDFVTRANSFGYTAWAENIAAGNTSAAKTFCQWKNSAGHNFNMLDSQRFSTGIGRAAGSGTYKYYWSSNFGDSVNDALTEPLTNDSSCVLPTTLPPC